MDEMNLFAPVKPEPPKEYEKLRDMERFSEEMLNRIIAFQERQHPAWDTSLSFEQRIDELSLHCLVFSNPDRDPEMFAATIAPYYPLHNEMQQIAHCIKQLGGAPVVCDLHAGNGFIGSLLAREGVNVIGLREPQSKPNQIEDFYDADCYQIREMEISEIDFPLDVMFSSWMPGGKNYTPEIIKHQPKMIIFVHTNHINEETGVPQTGTRDAFTSLPDNYKLIADWSLTRPKDLFREIWPELTPNIEETRHVKIYADKPYHGIDVGKTLPATTPYSWEEELEMALTAHKAKTFLKERGFPI